MHVYKILKDDYPIAQATGKKKAVEQLKKIILWGGTPTYKVKWINEFDEIVAYVEDSIYTIEKDKP